MGNASVALDMMGKQVALGRNEAIAGLDETLVAAVEAAALELVVVAVLEKRN